MIGTLRQLLLSGMEPSRGNVKSLVELHDVLPTVATCAASSGEFPFCRRRC
jgi:hypothetical protein